MPVRPHARFPFPLAVLVLCAGWTAARAAEPPPSALSPGFRHFYNLEFDEALAEFRRDSAAHPADPERHNHVAQCVLYREMFHHGALETEMVTGGNAFLRRKLETSPEATREFEEHIRKAIELSQARVNKNSKDLLALYSLGVSYGLRSNFNFLVRKAWIDSLKDASAARKNHQKVLEIDPNFQDARLVIGVHEYVVGSLPWAYRMLSFVAGFHGDRETGIRIVREVAEKGIRNRFDAKVLLCVVYRRERQPKQAIPLLQELISVFPRNYLFRLELAQMFGDAGDKNAGLEAIRRVEDLKRQNTSGFAALPYEKIWFYRGNLLFWYREYTAALAELKRVTPKTNELDLNTASMAWLRLGQTNDMLGRRPDALAAYRQAMQVAPGSDAARESEKYLSNPYKRTT